MWQRIQTVFLALVVLALVVFLWLPTWEKTGQGLDHRMVLDAWKLQTIAPEKTHIARMPYMVTGILALIGIVLAGYELVRFKKRTLQIKIGLLNNLVLIFLLGLIAYWSLYTNTITEQAVTVHHQAGFFMPLVATVCNRLASYFIRKDEALVQSSSRIR